MVGNRGNGVEGFQTPPGMDAKDMIMIIAARGGCDIFATLLQNCNSDNSATVPENHTCCKIATLLPAGDTVAIVQQWVNGADLLPELPRHLTY